MKALKKSMLILSVMTVIGGLGFSATAKNTGKRVVKKPVVKKVVTESYTCGADTIKVSYPTTKTARVVDGSGKPATGFISYNDQTYFLDKNGIMKTGWIKSSGSWYYLNDNGTLAVDQWIDNYYVDSTGKMTKIQ